MTYYVLNFPDDEYEPPKEPPQTISPGWYEAKIVGVEAKQARFSPTKYFQWEFRVVGVHEDFRLHYITIYNQLEHPYLAKKMAEFIKAVSGIEPKGVQHFRPETYLSSFVRVQVMTREFLGQTRNKIERVRSIHDTST